MTFRSDYSISKAKVDLERVPVYVENCCCLNCCYFGTSILIQSSVAQLVTHSRCRGRTLRCEFEPRIIHIIFYQYVAAFSYCDNFLVLELLNAVFLFYFISYFQSSRATFVIVGAWSINGDGS